MTISDRIFELLDERGIRQKEFSERTGISQSTISDWKKKSTNPASDKLVSICEALDVSLEYLLTGVESTTSRSFKPGYTVIADGTEEALLVEKFGELDRTARQRLLGYVMALAEQNI